MDHCPVCMYMHTRVDVCCISVFNACTRHISDRFVGIMKKLNVYMRKL